MVTPSGKREFEVLKLITMAVFSTITVIHRVRYTHLETERRNWRLGIRAGLGESCALDAGDVDGVIICVKPLSKNIENTELKL